MSVSDRAPVSESATRAWATGAGCYLLWGFIPLAFQAMGHAGIGVWEILAQRTIWAAPAAAVFVFFARQGGQAAAAARNLRVLPWFALAAAAIAVNWTIFISAANHGHLLETSLGYYINPLFNMAVGALFFGERMDRQGLAAIGLAVIGVVLQTLALGYLPMVSVGLAVTFTAYGLIKKQAPVDAQAGLLVECLFLAPLGLAYAIWLGRTGHSHFGEPVATAWMLASGPLTATPLVLFAWAARRLSLSAMGFLQFASPTITFFIGVAQGESFNLLRGVSFACIWVGAAIFVWGAWRRSRALALAAAL